MRSKRIGIGLAMGLLSGLSGAACGKDAVPPPDAKLRLTRETLRHFDAGPADARGAERMTPPTNLPPEREPPRPPRAPK